MNITHCPPGYAYGYAPQGELQSWVNDMARTSDPVRVLGAARNGAHGDRVSKIENTLTGWTVHGNIKYPSLLKTE